MRLPLRQSLRRSVRRSLLGDVSPATPPGPTLSLVISPASVAEDAGSTTGTVTRSGDTVGALTVTLSSNDTSEATVPATVDIPNGQASVNFTITILNENLADGDQVATISASATDFTGASDDVTVTDVGVPALPIFHDDFSSAGTNWAYYSGYGTVWGTVNSTAGQNVSFYAGGSSGQFGTAQRAETFNVTSGANYDFAYRTHRAGVGGTFTVVDASNNTVLATHSTNKAINTDHVVSFAGPASGQIRVRASSQWDYYEYADELAIVAQGAALPWA